MVEDGLTDSDEFLRERITLLKRDRDRAKTALDRIKARSPASIGVVASDADYQIGALFRLNDTATRQHMVRLAPCATGWAANDCRIWVQFFESAGQPASGFSLRVRVHRLRRSLSESYSQPD
jgi:hypothetical protein